jgi:hypothetical protein
VVSAFVAFRGWPGNASGESVTSVPLEAPRPEAVVRQVRNVQPALTTKRVASVGRAVASRAATTGLVKRVGASPNSTVGLLVKFPPGYADPPPGPPANAAPPAEAGPAPSPAAETPPAPGAPRVPGAPPEVETVVEGLVGPIPPVVEDGAVQVALPEGTVKLSISVGDGSAARHR